MRREARIARSSGAATASPVGRASGSGGGGAGNPFARDRVRSSQGSSSAPPQGNPPRPAASGAKTGPNAFLPRPSLPAGEGGSGGGVMESPLVDRGRMVPAGEPSTGPDGGGSSGGGGGGGVGSGGGGPGGGPSGGSSSGDSGGDWEEVVEEHPVPPFGIQSPVIQHLLSSWTQDAQKLR